MNISQSQEVRKKTILSEVIRSLKYARYLPEVKRRETWEETVERNIKMHVRKFPFLEEEIRQIYQGVLGYLYLPSMRSLQFGLDAVEKNNTRIYNCAYVPIIDVPTFGEIMFVLLSGCGVGFSVRKYHVSQLPKIQKMTSERTWLIDDSIEGWADAVKALISGYLELGVKIIFDYSAIRPEGAELKTSGGKAPGPEPLKRSLNDIETILAGKSTGDSLTTLDCHDIVCMLSEAVYAGGIRRSALLSLFSEDDEDMLNAKSGEWYLSPRGKHRARANNSVCFFRDRVTKEDFLRVWADVKKSGCGEPGIYFSKTQGDGGVNPCNEAYLEPYQFCNLTEVNVSDVLTQEDLDYRVKGAAFIGTLQASYTNFTYLRPVWKQTTERDALLGVGLTGIGSGRVLALDLKKAAQVVIKENERVAKLLGINPAARTTLLKPSGCQKKETMLITSEGILSLEELGDVKGDEWQDIDIKVASENTTTKKATKFYVNGISSTKKITTRDGVELEATLNHKFRVVTEEGEIVWKQVEDLEIGDVLPYDLGSYKRIAKDMPLQKLVGVDHPTGRSSNARKIKQPEYLDEDLAWVLGLYVGDGSNHARGIRISGGSKKLKKLEKAGKIIEEKFGISCRILTEGGEGDSLALYVNSVSLLKWLGANELLKAKSLFVSIPLIIRQSPPHVLEAYIDGYWSADGSTQHKSDVRTYCTTSKLMAEQVLICLRALGRGCSLRLMPPTESSLGTNMRYWISECKGWNGDYRIRRDAKWYKILKENGFEHYAPDIIVNIEDSECETYDIEVPDNRAYIANSVISHNTASLLLDTASGVHAWHAPFYIRRIRVGKNEPVYSYFKTKAPGLVEDDVFDHSKGVISFPIRAPEGSIYRHETTLELLERVKRFNQEWIAEGHRSGDNTHNVSATISMRDHEWEKVGEWMWENKDFYNGLSVLPMDGGTYQQMPFEDSTEEKIIEMEAMLNGIDITEIKEEEDIIDFVEIISCDGEKCERVMVPH